jgi:dihydroneopterin aldolase
MKLSIHALPIEARLGIYAEEQAELRTFTIDLTLEYDATIAVAEDDFAHAVDYAALEENLRSLAASRPWQLVETLAYHLAKSVVDSHNRVAWALVTVHKPQAMRYAQDVTLQVKYQRGE